MVYSERQRSCIFVIINMQMCKNTYSFDGILSSFLYFTAHCKCVRIWREINNFEEMNLMLSNESKVLRLNLMNFNVWQYSYIIWNFYKIFLSYHRTKVRWTIFSFITANDPAIFLFKFPTCERWNYTTENIALSNYCVMAQMIKTLRINYQHFCKNL